MAFEKYPPDAEGFYQRVDFQKRLNHLGCLSAICEMVAGIVHEINHPLLVVRFKTKFLMQRLEKDHPQAGQLIQSVKTILLKIQSSVDSVNSLKSFSRNPPERVDIIDPAAVIRRSLYCFTEQFRVCNIDLLVNITDPLPVVGMGPRQLWQIVVNLCRMPAQ